MLVFAYSLAAVGLSILIRKDDNQGLMCVPDVAIEGGPIRVFTSRPRRLGLPGIWVAQRLSLATRDGKVFSVSVDPEGARKMPPVGISVPAPGRGAYSSTRDSLECGDAFGLAVCSLSVSAAQEPRLLVQPGPLQLTKTDSPFFGNPADRSVPGSPRTESPSEHRPYVPGEDPRRLDWKIYARFGDLFVRVDDQEPPVGSAVEIIIEEGWDATLLSPDEARRGIDAICSAALTTIVQLRGAGIPLRLRFGGTRTDPIDAATAAALLAKPAARVMGSEREDLLASREAAEGYGRISFALPRKIQHLPIQEAQSPLEAKGLIYFIVPLGTSEERNRELRYAAETCAGAVSRNESYGRILEA